MNRNERLRRLDIMYQNAKDSLRLEKVRGYLMQWRNNFLRLDRIVANEDEYRKRGEDFFTFFFRSIVNDSMEFQNSHLDETDAALTETLINIEENLTNHIFDSAEAMHHHSEDLCDAILFLAAYNCISCVVEHIDDLINFIEQEIKKYD